MRGEVGGFWPVFISQLKVRYFEMSAVLGALSRRVYKTSPSRLNVLQGGIYHRSSIKIVIKHLKVYIYSFYSQISRILSGRLKKWNIFYINRKYLFINIYVKYGLKNKLICLNPLDKCRWTIFHSRLHQSISWSSNSHSLALSPYINFTILRHF